ncbi:hypothetical protein BMS3Bbin15_00806 [archaeon BMS3Bbin15]|nr:hypothetical protein BMS3Bbin15_00806 [archaeon BMS3Bbin15]
MKIIIIFVLLLLLLTTFPAVHSMENGYVKVWDKRLDNHVSAIQAITYNTDGKRNDIAVACYDGKVYFYNQAGKLEGSVSGKSSFTALAVYTNPVEKGTTPLAAGSLDNLVYSLWRPYGDIYIYSNPSDPKTPHNVNWYFNAGDNIYYITAVDLNEDGMKDSLAIGTGSYYSISPGKLILINYTGRELWEKSYNREVDYITSFDPDGDTFSSHIALAYDNTVVVLDKSGKQIWARTFKNRVTSIIPADFYGKDEITDILVSEGKTVHAINSRNTELWEKKFNHTITSLGSVHKDGDRGRIIYYYIVASGDYITALKNSPSAPEVLWRYYAGKPVGKIITFDLNSRGMAEDIAAFINNTITVYRKTFIRLPLIKIIPGKNVINNTEKLIIENIGDGNAFNAKIEFKIMRNNNTYPAHGFEFDEMKRYSEYKVNFTLDKEGNYTVRAVGSYTDEYGITHGITDYFTVEVYKHAKENKVQSVPVNKTFVPEITVNLSSPEPVTAGETFRIEVALKNIGNGTARNVSLKFNTTDDITPINTTWNGNLYSGNIKKINLTFKTRSEILMLRSREEQLPNASISYYSPDGKEYSLEIEAKSIKLKPSRMTYLFIILPLFSAGVLILYFKKNNKKDVEGEVVKIYLKYKKAGKAPTYSAFSKLGISKKTLKELLLKLKSEGKIK